MGNPSLDGDPQRAFDPLRPLLDRGDSATEADAQRVLRECYGREATASRLAGERDDNFVLRTVNGEQLFLKIAHSAEDPLMTQQQTAALLHLEGQTEVVVPSVIRSRAGDADCRIRLAGKTRLARLTTFLPGDSLVSSTWSAAMARSVGTTLGKLTRALADFAHPAAEQPQLWDIARASQLAPLIEDLRDAEMNRRLRELQARFEAEVKPKIPVLRQQLVHNDFSPDNLRGDDRGITGVIDFGDMTRTAIVFDLAVAIAYQFEVDTDPIEVITSITRAYHSVNPLTEAELDVLFEAIVARMLVRLAITEWRAVRFPENRGYIIRNNSRTWGVLAQLLAIDSAAVTIEIKEALGKR